MDFITQEKTCSKETFLDYLLLEGLEGRFQFALWKKPKDPVLHILIDKSERIKQVPLELEELKTGFILHPFLDQQDKKALYLEADEIFKITIHEEDVTMDSLDNLASKNTPKDSLKEAIKTKLQSQSFTEEDKAPVHPTTKEHFIKEVKKGIKAIQKGELVKIVPVKRKVIPQKNGFDLSKTILDLCMAYPNSFVNFFHIPHIGTWLGASPEVLIRTKGDTFSTMSLAGTQKATGNNPIKNVAWTQKEIEEQALVSRYIVNCFKKIRLREYEEIGPKTSVAGNLLHLRTDFKVDMKATNFPQLGSVMLDLLHPTSAVCGMPRDKAFEFIRLNEAFDRNFFAGFIGPVNFEQETNIYVNLRCARLIADQAVLYAGAGVTEDSVPEKEWEETEMKCDIIGNFINPS